MASPFKTFLKPPPEANPEALHCMGLDAGRGRGGGLRLHVITSHNHVPFPQGGPPRALKRRVEKLLELPPAEPKP
jgi:hypothetical protein